VTETIIETSQTVTDIVDNLYIIPINLINN